MSIVCSNASKRIKTPLHVRVDTYLSHDEVIAACCVYSTLASSTLQRVGMSQVFLGMPHAWPDPNSALLMNIVRYVLIQHGLSALVTDKLSTQALRMRQDIAQWLAPIVR